MSNGKSIRIYLDDGSVSGIRHAEIVNWTGQAVSSPRAQFKSLANWDESKKPGVYFLFGIDEESGRDAVYIGEAENIFDRLSNHLGSKDFWNEVVFFTSKDSNLTKSHVKYLESRLVELAKTAGRYVVQNGNEPQSPSLPRGDKDAMEEFLLNLKILLGVVGHKALQGIGGHNSKSASPKIQKDPQDLENVALELFLNVKNIHAKAHLTNEGIVVLSSSQASREIQDSLPPGYKNTREQLIKNGALKETGGGYVFSKDQLFRSPSQAAAVIVGYSINGRHSWKIKSGKSLKDVESEALSPYKTE